MMLLFPEAQHAAQQELDQVLHGNRLPDISDKESLPYIEALKREVLR